MTFFLCVCVRVCVYVCACVPLQLLQQLTDFHVTTYELNPIASQLTQEALFTYLFTYMCAVLKRLTTPSDFHIPMPSVVPFAHSYTSSTHGCIYPIFPSSSGTASFFFSSFGFEVNHNFGNRVRSILSTSPYQMSCFRVISSNIASGASIFSLIYSFVFLSSSEILADRLNASISVAWILLLSSSHRLQVSAP